MAALIATNRASKLIDSMQLVSNSFKNGSVIPEEFAFAKMDSKSHVARSGNQNPHIKWIGVPEGTKSFTLICYDDDVPSESGDVNKEGQLVRATLPRTEFFHWLFLDIPADVSEVAAGSQSNGVVPGGKTGPVAPTGFRHGINDYTSWFAGDDEMNGTYYGYDGPCPPWNDELLHHYSFTLFALNILPLEINGPLTGPQVKSALVGHVLGQATLIGTYSLNPNVKGGP
jgi:Raf kinase inhibitor-like YbhB/YbcL family protein